MMPVYTAILPPGMHQAFTSLSIGSLPTEFFAGIGCDALSDLFMAVHLLVERWTDFTSS